MTDLSYTREEDELLNDSPPESRRQKRPLAGETDNQEFGVKRRKSTTFRSLEVGYFGHCNIFVYFRAKYI